VKRKKLPPLRAVQQKQSAKVINPEIAGQPRILKSQN